MNDKTTEELLAEMIARQEQNRTDDRVREVTNNGLKLFGGIALGLIVLWMLLGGWLSL